MWQYSDLFARIDTCHEWGRRPSEFGICSRDEDFGVMMAYTRTVARMRAWERQEQEDEAEQQRHRAGMR